MAAWMSFSRSMGSTDQITDIVTAAAHAIESRQNPVQGSENDGLRRGVYSPGLA